MKKIILGTFSIFLMSASLCAAEGLDVLIQAARSQSEIKSQYKEETRNFEKVKPAASRDPTN